MTAIDSTCQRTVFFSTQTFQNGARVVSNSNVKESEVSKASSDCHKILRLGDVDRVSPQGSVTSNLVHYLRAKEKGRYPPGNSAQAWKNTLVQRLHRLIQFPFHLSFNRKISALSWHPTIPSLLVGTKGGEIAIHGYDVPGCSSIIFLPENKPTSTVIALKFHPHHSSLAYSASNNGLIESLNFHTQQMLPILQPNSNFLWKWLGSFDICPNKDMIVFGDTGGCVYFRDTNGEKICNLKNIHQSKVTHVEFCRKEPHFFVTSSNDHTVKIWDLRMISSSAKMKPLCRLVHENGVNSASFSPTNFSSLLTTDNYGDLRVYSTGHWNLKLSLVHPSCNRQLTSTKASWHPLADIIVVGHTRKLQSSWSIDFYDADTGDILSKVELTQRHSASLCCFNSRGDILAAKSGRRITFWESNRH